MTIILLVVVFDSSRHFLGDGCSSDFSTEQVLSQKDCRDPFFEGEIPVNALVAVLHTTSMYQHGNDFDKSISLNINGICVLVTPV